MTQQAPIRCTSCDGTGEGRTVVTGAGTYTEKCGPCKGAGQRPGRSRAAGPPIEAVIKADVDGDSDGTFPAGDCLPS